MIYQRFKTIQDLILQKYNRLKDFATEFVREVASCSQHLLAIQQDKVYLDLNILIINVKKRHERVKDNIKFMKRK